MPDNSDIFVRSQKKTVIPGTLGNGENISCGGVGTYLNGRQAYGTANPPERKNHAVEKSIARINP
jgi:hypothetical protein